MCHLLLFFQHSIPDCCQGKNYYQELLCLLIIAIIPSVCSAISAYSLSILFAMQIWWPWDPLIGNPPINSVFIASPKPPRAMVSPSWNISFDTHFRSTYISRNSSGRGASLLMVMNGAHTSGMAAGWIHTAHLLDQDGHTDPRTHLGNRRTWIAW